MEDPDFERLKRQLEAEAAHWRRLRDAGEFPHETDPSYAADQSAEEGYEADSIRSSRQPGENAEAARTRREFIGLAANLVAVGISIPTLISTIVVPERQMRRQEEHDAEVDYFVDADYADQLTSIEYNDPTFTKFADPKIGRGRAALHDSFVLARSGRLAELRQNTQKLRLAYSNSKDPASEAAILQRIAVNNNFLGLAQQAADDIENIPWPKLDVNSRIYSRSIDLSSTLKLNAVSREDFDCFRSFNAKEMCDRWACLGFDPRFSYQQDMVTSADKYKASISSALQARWILKLQESVRSDKGASLTTLRQDWVADYIDSVNRLSDKPYGASVASDFYYWLCRPAFHALRCGELEEAKSIVDLYFGNDPVQERLLNTEVRNQRELTIAKRAPNTQWMMLLRTICYLNNGDQKNANASLDELTTTPDGQTFRIENVAIARAAAEISIALKQNPFRMAVERVVNDLFYAPNISGGKAYFNLIRSSILL